MYKLTIEMSFKISPESISHHEVSTVLSIIKKSIEALNFKTLELIPDECYLLIDPILKET